MAEHPAETPRPTQRHVDRKPDLLCGKSGRQRPVHDETRIRSLPLHSMQCRLFWGQERHLSPRRMNCFFSRGDFARPRPRHRPNGKDTLEIGRLRSTVVFLQEDMSTLGHPYVHALRHVSQDHAALRTNGLATFDLRFPGMHLNAFNSCNRSSDVPRWEKAF